jgi:hypothetical protein
MVKIYLCTYTRDGGDKTQRKGMLDVNKAVRVVCVCTLGESGVSTGTGQLHGIFTLFFYSL